MQHLRSRSRDYFFALLQLPQVRSFFHSLLCLGQNPREQSEIVPFWDRNRVEKQDIDTQVDTYIVSEQVG